MTLDSNALCAAHPDVPATGVCRRCGGFLCAGCSRPYQQDVMCGDCYARLWFAPEVSKLAWAAFWLSILGMVAFLVPGVFAWMVAEVELRRIARGESPPGGKTFAQSARIVGMTCTGGLILVVLLKVREFMR